MDPRGLNGRVAARPYGHGTRESGGREGGSGPMCIPTGGGYCKNVIAATGGGATTPAGSGGTPGKGGDDPTNPDASEEAE
ncbi:MAG: hypothetical protein FJ102_26555, partial [Deltaproteobacteria bacterium]|nr:hypothetical protein [Deltaproteobacteria bacterium]